MRLSVMRGENISALFSLCKIIYQRKVVWIVCLVFNFSKIYSDKIVWIGYRVFRFCFRFISDYSLFLNLDALSLGEWIALYLIFSCLSKMNAADFQGDKLFFSWRPSHFLPGCSEPLGMKSGHIQDYQITASSIFRTLNMDMFTWEPRKARLDKQGKVNAWTSGHNDQSQWLQVIFSKNVSQPTVILPYKISCWLGDCRSHYLHANLNVSSCLT